MFCTVKFFRLKSSTRVHVLVGKTRENKILLTTLLYKRVLITSIDKDNFYKNCIRSICIKNQQT